MFLRIVLGQKVLDALVQILQPQQRAYAFAERVLVADHGSRPPIAG
jgi:hypothetical protein